MTSAAHAATEAKRIRASERAFRIALKVIRDAGLPVGKVCITGGQIEIHCADVDANETGQKDEGLKQW
ncbi:hypothetical protein J2X72_001178 [Phyllobacterium sp. 1468]|uniref:hypothetical protein n=1 Tax=Phyllobacterium sp. 1468 TaxID=2817759 RepID=UPI0028648038|nr:hypothetical protein [Phyllobacterium sp. 1468]MDR6632394.1 hypothetical protein [Phyllobacterium sp. 1468]